jgi:hypothetical protein
MSQELKLMTVFYVSVYKLQDEVKNNIRSYVEKINSSGDHNLEFHKDEVTFWFRDYTLLVEYIKNIVYLMNGWIYYHTIGEKDIDHMKDGSYGIIVWS